MQAQFLSQERMQEARASRDPRFDGLFYIGVKTTGIFCRPICKARMPLEKNVNYYTSAIDALKEGFRPCLMCRPDSAPSSFAWKGTETTVERGMNLLTQNFDLSINAIADKLGISTRYFNRLFSDYLQLSPKQYQLYCRLLFAKKLLHESALSIEEIAQASGFSSARQMQIHMKKTTGLSPSQVRKQQNLSSPSANREPSANKEPSVLRSQRIKVELAYRPPYDWEYMRAFFSLRQVHANELVTSGCLQKVLRINDQTVLMTAEHRAEKNLFEVTFELQELSILKDCIRAVRQMLDLDSDSLNITKMVARSGLPKQYIAEGLRLPGVIDKFEAGCRAIIGQQVSVKAAIGQLNLLHDTLLGSSVGSLRPFICANKVANADLSFLKMPQARKDTLKRLAQFIVESPNSHPKEWLTIKGVGPWTVNYVIMRTSTIPDIFLDTDLVVKNRISALLSQGIELKPDNSAPWRSYLTLSLWNAEGLNKHSSNK